MIKYKDNLGIVHEVEGLLWTGKTDKNGKDIFEHDILKIGRRRDLKTDSNGNITFDEERNNLHIVVWEKERCRFVTTSIKSFMDIEGSWIGEIYSSYEVVGNVKDNPEIIEEELKWMSISR